MTTRFAFCLRHCSLIVTLPAISSQHAICFSPDSLAFLFHFIMPNLFSLRSNILSSHFVWKAQMQFLHGCLLVNVQLSGLFYLDVGENKGLSHSLTNCRNWPVYFHGFQNTGTIFFFNYEAAVQVLFYYLKTVQHCHIG